MHQFFKNLSFVLSFNSFLVGIPWGVSAIIAGETTLGAIICCVSAILSISLLFGVAAYYHNRDINVNGKGYIAGLVIFVVGVGAYFIFGPANTVVFLKIVIIAIAVGLHSMVETKTLVCIQKFAFILAFFSVAFLESLLALGIMSIAVLMVMMYSVIAHTNTIDKQE